MKTFEQRARQFGYRLLAFGLFTLPMMVLAPEGALAQSGTFQNPLRFPTIEAFVEGALQALVYVALPAIGFFIVLSGFQFIAAQGDPTKLGKAKMNFVHVVIGAALILGAWALAMLIKGTIDQLRG